MRVLVVGAGGFIGSRIVGELLSRKHVVVCCGRSLAPLRRRFPTCELLSCDLAHDDAGSWHKRLVNVDGVINAAGTLRGDLDTIHRRGPIALFNACACIGMPHLVQISALGAGEQDDSRFLATKAAADRHLLCLAQERGLHGWSVLRPSLVIGRGGGSTELFSALAATLWPIRLGNGSWRVQPIHVGDLARVAVAFIEAPCPPPLLDTVGQQCMSTNDLTGILRAWLGLPSARPVTLPLPIIKAAAWLGDNLPTAPLSTETLTMLTRGSTADVEPLTLALGWTPRRLGDALMAEPSGRPDRWFARLLPLRIGLRIALFAVWMGSGIASFVLTPEQTMRLLSRLAHDPAAAIAITWAGAGLDVTLALALLWRPWRQRALQAQLAVMFVYTALATMVLPMLWADPFGPLVKNLAVLAATLVLLAIED
jgi:uncharacterized protein YbjT (DUF2867 family)